MLEPDSTVPNSSTDLGSALVIAMKIGIQAIPVLETDRKMAEYIDGQI